MVHRSEYAMMAVRCRAWGPATAMEARTLDIDSYPAFIAGRKITTDAWLEVLDPATGSPIAHVARCGAPEVDAAVAAARGASESAWRTSEASERSLLLR